MNLFSAVADRLRIGKQLPAMLVVFVCLFGALFAPVSGSAQTSGMAGIQGTVVDESGAVVPNATVTATNNETHQATVRNTTNDGVFTIAPILPGTYTVEVVMPGFSDYQQKNLSLDAMKMTPLNIVLKTGAANETVIVSEAPPTLDTNSATLGGVMENKQYANLPIQMGGQQRDPTAFATLMPGAQGGARAPIIGGSANYSAELYLDGLPLTVATQQGDNRVVMNSISIDSIDQFQVQTSAIPPEYQGAGLMNFTIKRGGSQYHGSANFLARNTVFDTWSYTQKRSYSLTGVKPNRYENQNEVTGTIGGTVPVKFLKDRLFFFEGFMRYHGRNGAEPGYLTVPTTKMRTGDFSELLAVNGGPGYVLYDPMSTATCTANNGGKYCRYPFGQSWTGAVDTTQATNVLPSGYISKISQYMQKFLPTPSNSALQNNWLGGQPTGYDNWMSNSRVDYKISDSQNLAFVFAHGTRKNAPYTMLSNPSLPMPYIQASSAQIDIDLANLYHTYTINPHMVNSAKFGFMYFGGPPIKAATDLGAGNQYSATAAGITNLPLGQASDEFPGTAFGGNYAPTKWTYNGASQATYTSKSVGYTFGDNLLYQVGRHSFTFGAQYQMLEANADSYDGNSGILTSTYNVTPTAGLASSSSLTSNTGFSYASFLMGGVGSMATTIQSIGVVGGRYHPFAPYVNDDYKVNSKLTLNLGFRWDYLPPYHETSNRWSFLNPTLTNPLTGNLGMMQFAGNGANTCNCRTPVQTYWKNIGPRVGLAYSINDKTVVHAGFGIFYSHGGGVGGRAGAAVGTGQLGYSTSPSFAETTLSPAFWLNNGSTWTANSMANTAFGGSSFTLPTPTGVSTAGQLLNTGNYVNGAGAYVQSAGSVGYADPYVSGRAPTFNFFNFGIQRVLTNSTTLSVNYSGSESHFIPAGSSAAVGQWANQLDPKYMVGLATTKTASGANILSAQATSANIAAAQASMASIGLPYAGYAAAGNASAKATIQQMLLAFPQYSGVSNTWGYNVGNNSYHSLQVSLIQRDWKGLSFQAHYTFSKNIGDDGTYRSGYDIPAAAIDAGGKSFKRGRADRSWTSVSIPHSLRAFGVYQSPFGKGKIGSDNYFVSKLAGDWLLSGIFAFTSGTPLSVTAGTCYSTGGTCMPNTNPNFTGKAKISDFALDSQPHIDSNAFIAPAYYGSTQACTKNCTQMFGNAPRSRAYGLTAPKSYNLDMGLKRTFPLPGDRFKLQIEANCLNVTHAHTFGGIGTALPAPTASSSDASTIHYLANGTFGVATTASGNRDWQFAGHINF